jgi:hypothetical protein
MNQENLDQILVFCRDFKHKSKKLASNFSSHPKKNYVYKALLDRLTGDLRVFLPSGDESMFGIRFDAMSGGEKEYSYAFEVYSDQNCVEMNPDSLNFLPSAEMQSWEMGLQPKLPFSDEDIEEVEESPEIHTMTLEEMIKSESMFVPYVQSLLGSIQAYSDEILQGLVYSIEDAVEVLSEGLKMPLNRIEVIESLQRKLEEQKSSDKPYYDTDMVVLFFALSYLNNKGN